MIEAKHVQVCWQFVQKNYIKCTNCTKEQKEEPIALGNLQRLAVKQ